MIDMNKKADAQKTDVNKKIDIPNIDKKNKTVDPISNKKDLFAKEQSVSYFHVCRRSVLISITIFGHFLQLAFILL